MSETFTSTFCPMFQSILAIARLLCLANRQPTTWKQSCVRVWEFDHVIQFVTKKDSFCDVGVRSVDLVFSFVWKCILRVFNLWIYVSICFNRLDRREGKQRRLDFQEQENLFVLSPRGIQDVWQTSTLSSWRLSSSSSTGLSSTTWLPTTARLPTTASRLSTSSRLCSASGSSRYSSDHNHSTTYCCCCGKCSLRRIAGVNDVPILQCNYSDFGHLQPRHADMAGLWRADFGRMLGWMLPDTLLHWWHARCCALVSKLPKATRCLPPNVDWRLTWQESRETRERKLWRNRAFIH